MNLMCLVDHDMMGDSHELPPTKDKSHPVERAVSHRVESAAGTGWSQPGRPLNICKSRDVGDVGATR